MKLHFEPDLDYQHHAIESVCDLFRGQEICRTEFTVTRDATAAQQNLAFAQSDLGIGNRLQLLDDEILANLGGIQLRNGLSPSASLASGDFTVEMETGTGKTYEVVAKFTGNRSLTVAARIATLIRNSLQSRARQQAVFRRILQLPPTSTSAQSSS
jgi:hypothetical protein